MADETTTDEQQPEQDPDEFQIDIRYNRKTGAMHFVGPIGDPILCFGMLALGEEMARRMMQREAMRQAQQQRIVQPGDAPLPPEFRQRRP
jgi:hypothetical protein